MPIDDPLQIRIGRNVLFCESVEHASILMPVNEILTTGVTDAYSIDQLEEMVVTLERYDRRTGHLRRN